MSRTRDDTCVEELVPSVGQAGEAPVYAISIRGRVGLLLRSQHLALADGVDRRVRVLAVFRQGSDVDEVDWHFDRLSYVVCDHKEPAVRANLQWSGHVQNRHCLFGTFYACRVVPVQAPISIFHA